MEKNKYVKLFVFFQKTGSQKSELISVLYKSQNKKSHCLTRQLFF